MLRPGILLYGQKPQSDHRKTARSAIQLSGDRCAGGGKPAQPETADAAVPPICRLRDQAVLSFQSDALCLVRAAAENHDHRGTRPPVRLFHRAEFPAGLQEVFRGTPDGIRRRSAALAPHRRNASPAGRTEKTHRLSRFFKKKMIFRLIFRKRKLNYRS